jgi:hypothetical protein
VNLEQSVIIHQQPVPKKLFKYPGRIRRKRKKSEYTIMIKEKAKIKEERF